MNIAWNNVWAAHPDLFIVRDWQECPADKRKAWRLPIQYTYFMAGVTSLRVGIVATDVCPHEDEFLLAGMSWGNRLSNGAKTLIYFVAPDFSPAFLRCLAKIGGNISVRAVYWREKLTPSLYLIPENHFPAATYVLNEERPNWDKWGRTLNPVVRQQLNVVRAFFEDLAPRRVTVDFRPDQIGIYWGNFEIAEVRRKGKKFDLATKAKWAKTGEQAALGQRQGWVDAAGHLNSDFCSAVHTIVYMLEQMEKAGDLRVKDLLVLRMRHGDGVLTSLWGYTWPWPWLPKERGDSWVADLGQWFFYRGDGQLSVVCPILERPMCEASQSLILTAILETGVLERALRTRRENLVWDGRVHWLTLPSLEEDLRRWHDWLHEPEQFPVWILPEGWHQQGLNELICRSAGAVTL